MAQTRVPAQQHRDRDLTGSDELLTDETLDGLWEWFCNVANEDKFQSQLIFAKLVNAARKPYRDNHSLPQHCDRLFTPGTSRYASSECTSGYIEGQQHPQQSEDKGTMEALSTKLAIAEDSAQTKKTIIKHLEDSLQMKQTIVNQLEARIQGMEQELGEINLRHEGEKKQLDLDLKKVRQEYLEYKEKEEVEKMQLESKRTEMEGEKKQLELDLKKVRQEYIEYKEKEEVEKMQLESKLTEMDQMLQEYKQKVEGEKKQLELDLKKVRQEYLEYKETEEGERMQLESKLKEMDQSQQEYKQKVEDEKKQLELDLKKVQQDYLECKEKGEGEKVQLESKLKEMHQAYQDYKEKVEGEKTQLQLKLKIIDQEYAQYKTKSENEKTGLENSLQQLQAEHKKCGLRFVLKLDLDNTFINFSGDKVPTFPVLCAGGLQFTSSMDCTRNTTITASTTFILENHPSGMVSFRATTPCGYLGVIQFINWGGALGGSWGGSRGVTLGDSREMFRLHEDGKGGRYIEPAEFPGKFLTACGQTGIELREGKSAAALFQFVAR
ncbi:hypothetical protein BDZ91DRAFT_849807 [Kalaharituber pfeilii]|nr:hypothetical protein BDZ91DRAFT_849807 [Kalaharituber pfeilii]